MEAVLEQPETIESDLALLKRYVETRDESAFAEIVRRYSGVVFSASQRVLNDEARSRDASQEAFFRLSQKPEAVTHSLGGWLHRAATYLALDAKRSELARRHRERTYAVARPAEAPRWEDISPYIDSALSELPEPMRTLLIRHYLQGTPQNDLAVALNTSPATICRRLKTGVEELQKVLRRRGIYVALIALSEFVRQNMARAAPPLLVRELGKMTMVSGGTPIAVVPMTPPPPAVLWPSALKVPGSAPAGGAGLRAAVWGGGLAGALVVVALILAAVAAPHGGAQQLVRQPNGRDVEHVDREAGK